MIRMLLVVSWGLTLAAQTQIDLRTQARNIDFSAATSTRPMKTGTALPATCAVGNMFFKTDAPAGANLYGCSTANTWMVQGGIPMGNCQYNANSQILTCTDSSNDVYTTVETATSGTAGQFRSEYVDGTGRNSHGELPIQREQPNFDMHGFKQRCLYDRRNGYERHSGPVGGLHCPQ